MKALYYSRGTLQAGLPIEQFAKAMQEASRQNPQAKVEDLAGKVLFFWDPRMGPGELVVEAENGTRETLAMPVKPGRARKSGTVLIDAPCVLRLAPETGEGLTVNVATSGSYTVVAGSQAAPSPLLPDQGDDDPLRTSARAWLRDGRVGLSSYALCVGITGVEDPQRRAPKPLDIPYDADDFGRCMAFLQAVPLARQHFGRMGQCGAYWQELAMAWEELETLHEQKKMQALDERLAQIRDAVKARADGLVVVIGQSEEQTVTRTEDHVRVRGQRGPTKA